MLIGLVGKPSTGKSTFFQALTSVPVARAAYPFTTIEPNRGVAYVEVECVDKDFNAQCNPRTGFCINHRRFVPVDVLDVAGLVPGAHEGKGLGNKFLDDLRQADLLIHIVDASGSSNAEGESVAPGSYDPVNDVKFLEEELIYWIKGILDKNWKKLSKDSELGEKNEIILSGQFCGLGIQLDSIKRTLKELNLEEKKLQVWSEEEKFNYCKKMREIGKPIIIAANKCDLSTSKANIERLKKTFPTYLIVPCSAEAEITLKTAAKAGFIEYVPGDGVFKLLKDLSPEQKRAMDLLFNLVKTFDGTGVQRCLNSAVFDYLKYIAVFPGGVNNLVDSQGRTLPDCFLLPPNSTAIYFAGAIHSDFAKKFIKAIDVKTKMSHGADHVLKHRDVIEFMFGR
ncbi:MAG: redox-regulated ATPase YchF [Candidatus Micrarchaeota archaeon]